MDASLRFSHLNLVLPSGWYRGFSTKKPSIKVIITAETLQLQPTVEHLDSDW